MIKFVALKALAGVNYVRADQVVAIAAIETSKCNVYLAGGVVIPCAEPAKEVIARLEAAWREQPGEAREEK